VKERPKGNFKDGLNDIKKLLKYIIKETIATNETVTKVLKGFLVALQTIISLLRIA
jgi:hypothetical protein